MTKSTHRRLLLAAVEQTYGTFETIAGTDAILVSNLDCQPLDPGLVDRDLVLPFFGNRPKIIGQRVGTVTFDVELAGSGTAGTAPRWGRLLRACGFGETVVGASPGPASVTYAPAMSNIVGVSFDFNNDGNRHRLAGCRGNASFNLAVGEIPRISFEFYGLYVAAATETQLSPTFANQAAPVIVNSANTTGVNVLGLTTACMESFSLDLGNELPLRQLAGCAAQYPITNRLPSGEVVIEAPVIGSGTGEKDYFAQVISQATGTIAWQHGQTAGNIVNLSMGQCNIDGPTYSDSEGIQMLNLPYMAQATAANNEMSLVLT
jgi:hypothetical protein